MKKKILLALVLALVAICLFAISVSAEYNKSETVTVTLKDGSTQSCALYDAQGNELVWYTLDEGATLVSVKTRDLFCDEKGNKLVDSSSLTNIYLDDSTPLQKHNENTINCVVVANLRGCTFEIVTHASYKATFHNSKILQYIYLPNTVTSLGCNIFQYCSNVKVIDIPSDASFVISDANGFVNCTSLAEINLIGCTKIGSSSSHHSIFSGCTSLTRVIIDPDKYAGTVLAGNLFSACPLTQFGLVPNECHIPGAVTDIGVNVFKGSRFTKIYFGEAVKTTGYNIFDGNTNLTEVHFNSNYETMDQRAFMNCTSLQKVYDLENTKLTAIPHEAFKNTKIEEIILPNTVVSIAESAFYSSNNQTTTKVVLGANFTTFVSHDGFKNANALKELYIPAGCTSIPGNVFNSLASDCVIYFTGTKAQLDTLIANTNSNNTAFLNACKQAVSVDEFNNLEAKSGRYIVYGYNKCDAFYNGIHDKTQLSPCVALCNNCGNSDETHDSSYENSVVEYASFLKAGAKVTSCENKGCTYSVTEELPALFSCKGFSASNTGNGISLGFEVNNKAIADYTSVTGKILKYGVFAGSQSNLDTKDIFDADVSEKVITAEIEATEFSAFDIKVVGFKTETQKSTLLALGAYVELIDDNGTAYSYMQIDATDDAVSEVGEKYVYVTFDSIVNN